MRRDFETKKHTDGQTNHEKTTDINIFIKTDHLLYLSCVKPLPDNKILDRSKLKQEGHDGPVSLHWLILGNLFKT